MVIDVNTAMKKIQERNAPLIEKLETIIDEAIINQCGRFPVTIDTKTAGNIPSNIIQNCLNKYRTAGWDANYNNNQRDGNYISIKPKKQQNNTENIGSPNYVGLYGMGGSGPYEKYSVICTPLKK